MVLECHSTGACRSGALPSRDVLASGSDAVRIGRVGRVRVSDRDGLPERRLVSVELL
jgi:hypothetical protein